MKKVSKQILAFIMVFALMIVSAPMVYAASSVTQITLKGGNEIVYFDQDGDEFTKDNHDYYYDDLGLDVDIAGDGTITIKPVGGGQIDTFSFGVKTEGKDIDMKAYYQDTEVKSPTTIFGTAVDAEGTYASGETVPIKAYTIKYNTKYKNPSITYEFSFSEPPHNVTLPAPTTQYSVKGNSTVKDGEDYNFTLTVYSEVADYVPFVKAGGTSLDNPSPGTDGQGNKTYNYTVNGVKEDLIIAVDLKGPSRVVLPTGQGYTATPKDGASTSVPYNGSFKFDVTVDENYGIPTVYTNGTLLEDIDGNAHDNIYTYEIKNVIENQTVTVDLKAPVVVNLPTGTGYVAKSKSTSNVIPYGSDFEFTVTVEEGYGVPVVNANGSVLDSTENHENVYTYKIDKVTLTQNVTISVSKERYNIKIVKIGDGFQTTASDQNLEYGAGYSFTVSPKEGYSAPTVTAADDLSLTVDLLHSGTNYTLSSLTKNVTITITSASKLSNQVILNVSEGYTITDQNDSPVPGNTASVDYGENYTFRVKLDDAYSKSTPTVAANSINLDGRKIDDTNVYEYTITGITDRQVVTVTGVTRNTYKVNLIQGTGYTLTAVSATTVAHGSEFEFSLSLDPAYAASSPQVKSTGTAQPAYNGQTKNYTITVTEDIEISVEGIQESKFQITYSEKTDGYDIQSSSGHEVAYNGSFNFTVKVHYGYKLVSVNRLEGDSIYSLNSVGNNSYAINNITSDQQIQIVVEKIKYTVRYHDAKNGNETIDYDVDNQAVNKETSIITLKVPASVNHYKFIGWFDEDERKRETLSLGNDNSSIILTAKWELDCTNLFTVNIGTPSWSQKGDRYNLHVLAKWNADVVDELGGAEITSVGMFYSYKRIADQESALTALLEGKDPSPGKHTEQAAGRADLYIYNHNVSFTSEQEAGEIDQLFQNLQADANRSVRAYVQVKIAGKTYTYYSDVWYGSYNTSH